MRKFIFVKLLLLCAINSYASLSIKLEDYSISLSENSFSLKNVVLPNGLTLEYVEQGDANGVPVLLLHGFTDSWHSYEMVLPHLPQHLHAYAVTQRGHGNSSRPLNGYEPVDFADDIAAFMQTLNIKPAVLVGHSMSSSIAQCFAVKYPDLTKGIVLIGAFADYNKPDIIEFRDYVKHLTDPVDSSFVVEFQTGTIEKPIPAVQLETFIRETLKVPAYVWKAVTAGWDKADFRAALKQIEIPALIVWGDKDGFCPRIDQDSLHEAMKRSRLLVYEGIGHALHWEEPKKFADDLVSFIKNIMY